MRILITVDPEIPVPPRLYGGIERIAAGLISALRGSGHTIGLAAHAESSIAVDALFPWPGLRSNNRMDTVRNTSTLWRAVRFFEPDVVHSFSRLLYLLPLLSNRLPKIMSYQRDPSPWTTRWANRLGRHSLRFTGCSEYICRLGRPAGGNWTAIPNFVDVERFTFVPNVPDDAPLVFLSRVESIKGPHLAIETARRTGRRLVIAGNHSATPFEARFWREQVEPHLGKNGIEYVGPVNDKQKDELLGQAAALLVPVLWDEPFGIVFAEALACGTPIISCPRGALPEIVVSGQTGFVADSIAGLCDAVVRVATFDRRLCRQAAEQRFSANVIAGVYEALYHRSKQTLAVSIQ